MTIRKAIRDHLGLPPGDRVKYFPHDDGRVDLLPKLPVTALRGIINPRQPAVTIEEMTDAAAPGERAGRNGNRTVGWRTYVEVDPRAVAELLPDSAVNMNRMQD
jgi:antitoxin PrlF